MEPPESIDIGCYTYRVSRDRTEMLERCHDQHADLLGFCDSKTLTINLEPTQAEGMARETLLHEILHAVADLTGLGNEWDTDQEESTIRRLSPVILALLRANPALTKYLTAA